MRVVLLLTLGLGGALLGGALVGLVTWRQHRHATTPPRVATSDGALDAAGHLRPLLTTLCLLPLAILLHLIAAAVQVTWLQVLHIGALCALALLIALLGQNDDAPETSNEEPSPE